MAKDTDGSMNPNNMLYLVYKVQSSANLPEDGIHQSFSYYYTVQFNNLTVSPDGKISVNLGEYSTSRDRFRKELDVYKRQTAAISAAAFPSSRSNWQRWRSAADRSSAAVKRTA